MQAAAPQPDHRTVAENLRLAMRNYALAAAGGALEETPGLTLVSSGIRYAAFNAAVLSDPPVETAHELAARLGAASRFYIRRREPWSCWICHDLLPSRVWPEVARAFHSHGLSLVAEHQGMQAERLQLPVRPLPELRVEPVESEATRRHFCELSRRVFQVPALVARPVYAHERFWQGEMTAFVGYIGDDPVCMAATADAAGAVGVYSVGTLPEFRRRGLGEAITRFALAAARQRGAGERTVLQSTEDGLRLYEQMGYRPVTRFSVFATS